MEDDNLAISPLELNNQMVKMRKVIDQAKLRCSRKMIQQVKILKSRKGTEEQMEKNRRKYERLVEELKEMKKLKPLDVSKFSLLNTKTFEELCKKASKPADFALYKIVTSDLLIDFVDEFRIKHKTWPIEVPFILQRLGAQYKSKSEKVSTKKRKTTTKNKTVDKVSTENGNGKKKMRHSKNEVVLVEKSSNGAEEVQLVEHRNEQSPEAEYSREKSLKVAEFKESEMQFEKLDKQRDFEQNESEVAKIQESMVINEGTTMKNVEYMQKTLPKRKVVAKKAVTKKIPKKNVEQQEPKEKVVKKQESKEKQVKINVMEVRRLNLADFEGDEFFPSTSKEVKPKKMGKASRIEFESDPFFDGGDEKNSNIFAKIDEDPASMVDDEEEEDGRGKSKRLKSKFSASLKNKGEENNKDGKTTLPKFLRKNARNNANLIPVGKQPLPKSSYGNLGNRRLRREKMRQEVARKQEAETLHPSWKAKRCQQTSLVPSTGKKIKFAEDD